MSRLEVRIGDAPPRSLEPDRTQVVGRGAAADVRVEGPSVSRHHLDLVAQDGRWTVRDRSSTGTFVAGEPIERLVVAGPVRVALGGPAGPFVELTPTSPSPVPPSPVPESPAAPAMPVPEGESRAGTVALDDRALRLDLDDQQVAVQPGTRVVVGRDPSCDLRSTDRLVSGQHCAFEHDGSNWVVTDLDSTRGTYRDGRRLTESTPVEGAFHLRLGDATAGQRLRVVTAGEYTPPRARRWPLALAMVVVMAVAVAAGLLLDRGGPANSSAHLAAAKQATVLVLGDQGNGSGAFVTADLVLTNHHVAQLGDEFLLAASAAEDEPVRVRYRAEVAAVHPWLDIALLRVVAGAALEEGEVVEAPIGQVPEPLRLGDSTSLRAGNGIHSLGFPAVTSTIGRLEDGTVLLPVVTVAGGEVVTFQAWPGCDDPAADVLLLDSDASSCAADGTLPRGQLLTDDLSGRGGSGGPVLVDGEIVAVRFAGRGPEDDSGSTAGVAFSIPVEYFAPWLDQQGG